VSARGRFRLRALRWVTHLQTRGKHDEQRQEDSLRAPWWVAAREFVSIAIDAHRVNPNLHRVLAEQIPRIGRLENIEAIERDAYALVRGYLEAHRDEIDDAAPDLAAFICVTAVEALTHAAVLRRPDILTDEKAGRFVDDVTGLVVRYLRKP